MARCCTTQGLSPSIPQPLRAPRTFHPLEEIQLRPHFPQVEKKQSFQRPREVTSSVSCKKHSLPRPWGRGHQAPGSPGLSLAGLKRGWAPQEEFALRQRLSWPRISGSQGSCGSCRPWPGQLSARPGWWRSPREWRSGGPLRHPAGALCCASARGPWPCGPGWA